jgi:hypothetical protein
MRHVLFASGEKYFAPTFWRLSASVWLMFFIFFKIKINNYPFFCFIVIIFFLNPVGLSLGRKIVFPVSGHPVGMPPDCFRFLVASLRDADFIRIFHFYRAMHFYEMRLKKMILIVA